MLKIEKIKPLFTTVVTTADEYEEDVTSGGIITDKDETQGSLKLYQRVLEIGSSVRDVKVGDMVMINPANYTIRKYDKNSLQNDLDNNPKIRVVIPTEVIEDAEGNTQKVLIIQDRDIRFAFEGKEVPDLKNKIIVPKKEGIIFN